MNHQVTKLTEGNTYDFIALRFAGWSNGQADYGGMYHGEFFDYYTGRYMGPDEDGVEPLYYAETAADLIDSYLSKFVRKATVAEMAESLAAGPEGHILIDGRLCYVAID